MENRDFKGLMIGDTVVIQEAGDVIRNIGLAKNKRADFIQLVYFLLFFNIYI